MALSYLWNHLTGNLTHDACRGKLCQVSAKGADRGGLYRGHHFCIECSRDVQCIDAGKNLAHRVDKCLDESIIMCGMRGIEHYYACRGQVRTDSCEKFTRRKLKWNVRLLKRVDGNQVVTCCRRI